MAEDKIKTMEFIEDYRTCQALWDHKHIDYSNKTKRIDALISLGKKHNYDIQTVKNKIKSLRSYFSKEHHKVVTKRNEPGTEDYQSSWFAYKSLLFILDSMASRETIDSIENFTANSSNPATQDESGTDSAEIEYEDTQPLKKRNIDKPRVDKRDEETYNTMRRANENMINKDECDAFGQLIALKLLKLNPRNRLLAEHRINEVLFHLELEEIDSMTKNRFDDSNEMF